MRPSASIKSKNKEIASGPNRSDVTAERIEHSLCESTLSGSEKLLHRYTEAAKHLILCRFGYVPLICTHEALSRHLLGIGA